MKLSSVLQTNAQNRLNTLFIEAINTKELKHLSRHFVQPNLLFKQRGRIAGSAILQANTIKLNPILYSQNPDYFLSHIIAHELAHILVYQLYGLRVKPHGIEWKKIMLDVFKLPPKVTHTLDISHAKIPAVRTIQYQCDCGSVRLSIIRHNKVVKKHQAYVCRKCKKVLLQAVEID
jgi:SprT protein